MLLGAVLKSVLVVVIAVLVIAAALWMRRHPNRAKTYPEQQRLPLLVPIAGWLLLAVGLLLGLLAFSTNDAHDPTAMRIGSVVLVAGGLALLLAHRNFFLAVRADEVAFRSVFGREQVIPYVDIAEHRMSIAHGRQTLTIRSASTGRTLVLNARTHDLTPLLMAVDFRQRHGRWPLRGETVGLPGSPGPGLPPR